MKKSWGLNLIYLLLAAIVLIVLLQLSPAVCYQPHGVFLPARSNTHYPPTKKLRLYLAFPAKYTIIGEVSVVLHEEDQTPNRQQEQKIVNAALRIAAQHGASGLLVQQLYFVSPQQVRSVLAGYQLVGVAFR